MITIHFVLLVLAFLLLLLTAFGVNPPKAQLGWLGLSIWVLAELLGGIR